MLSPAEADKIHEKCNNWTKGQKKEKILLSPHLRAVHAVEAVLPGCRAPRLAEAAVRHVVFLPRPEAVFSRLTMNMGKSIVPEVGREGKLGKLPHGHAATSAVKSNLLGNCLLHT